MPEARGKMLESGRSRILFALLVAFIVIGLAALFVLLRERRWSGIDNPRSGSSLHKAGEAQVGEATTNIDPPLYSTTAAEDALGLSSIYSTPSSLPNTENLAESETAKGSHRLAIEPEEEDHGTESTSFGGDRERREEEEEDERPTASMPFEEGVPEMYHAPQCVPPLQHEQLTPACGAKPPRMGSSEGAEGGNRQDWDSAFRVRLLAVGLNFSLASREANHLNGNVDLLLETLKAPKKKKNGGKAFHLIVGKHLRFTQETTFTIWHCEAAKSICISGIRLDDKGGLAKILLEEEVKPGTHISVRITNYKSTDIAGNTSFLVQRPLKWERSRAWLLASVFNRGSPAEEQSVELALASVFPIASTQKSKAQFKFCLQHPSGTHARSNMEMRSVETQGTQTTSCFEESPLISIGQFAFLIYDNFKQLPSTSPLKVDKGKVNIEVLVSKHMQTNDLRWLVEETEQALHLMASITSVRLPIEKLTVVATPLPRHLDATGNLGLVQFKETWLEYPKYQFTHTVLTLQIIRQWVGNALTFCDPCIEAGLSTYLEWVVSSEVNPSSPDTNVTKRFRSTRDRIMGGSEPGSRLLAFDPSLLSSNQASSTSCGDRVAMILYMLEKTFERESLTKQFIPLLAKRCAWTTHCISTKALSPVFFEAVGSNEAKRVFDTFILAPPDSQAPVLHLHLHPNRTLGIVQSLPTQLPSAIPIEVVDEAKRVLRLILHDSQKDTHKPANYIAAVPNSFVRQLYNVENYEKLAECFSATDGTSTCASMEDYVLRSAIGDLCWALLDNRLSKNGTQSLGTSQQWHSLFRRLAAKKGVLHGDCLCCMQDRQLASATAQCRWTWQDKCTKIELLKN